MGNYSTKIQTVTEITSSIKGLLETQFAFVSVSGEISNLRQPYSGHLYFTLKDEHSQLKAVMFKPQIRYLSFVPLDGKEVICRGRITVYEPRGEYQLVVDFIEAKGVGALQIAFEELKNRLAKEGLFDQAAKKRIPFFPRRVALVTSPSGAALFDFLRIAKERFYSIPIEIFPVRVQGEGAAEDIVEALAMLNEQGRSDVIVLCRGGGSIEDLWCFNEEKVARAIFASDIPVVSAVGHEIDFTIADLVADFRAPTPTAAAEIVIPSAHALREKVLVLNKRLVDRTTDRLSSERKHLLALRRVLRDPRSLLDHSLLRLDYIQAAMAGAFLNGLAVLKTRLQKNFAQLFRYGPEQRLVLSGHQVNELMSRLKTLLVFQLQNRRQTIQKTAEILAAMNPRAILGRGYAIVRAEPDGIIVRSTSQVKEGQELEVVLHKGRLSSTVKEILE